MKKNTQESPLIRYVFCLALVGVVLSLMVKSWGNISIIKMYKGDDFFLNAIEMTIYVLGISLVIYRLKFVIKNGIKYFRPVNDNLYLLRKIGIYLMITGSLFSFVNETILFMSRLKVMEINFIYNYLRFLRSGLEISIIGICMYEVSRFTVAEIEFNKANSRKLN